MSAKKLAKPTGARKTSKKTTALQQNLWVNLGSGKSPRPTVYHPEYSHGIRNNDSAAAVSAYWIKHDGENLYEV